jgi:hypothetical protein
LGALPANYCGGDILETWTFTDLCSRPITKTRVIHILPATVAAFATPDPLELTVACGAAVTSNLGYDNGLEGDCEISGTVTSTLGTLPNYCGGDILETWTFTDLCSRTITKTRVIHILPAALPTMTAPGNITVECTAIPSASKLTYTNNKTGVCLITGLSNLSTFATITPGVCNGEILETWTAGPDPCGRAIASVSRTIYVQDRTAPVIDDEGPNQIAYIAGPTSCTAAVPDFTAGVTAHDNCGFPVTDITQVPAVGFTYTTPGDKTITITVKDACGNAADPFTRTLTVYDGPKTTIPDLTVCIGSNFGVPVNVTSFHNVKDISLTIKFNDTKIQYLGTYTNNSGLIQTVYKSGSGADSYIKIGAINLSTPNTFTGTLLTLNFKHLTGNTALTLWDTPGTESEYSFPIPNDPFVFPYCDTPYDEYYFSGSVTEKALPTVEAGDDQTVCENIINVTTVKMTGYSYSGATGGVWSGGHGTWVGDVYTPSALDLYSVVLTYTTTGAYPCANISDTKTLYFDKQPVANAGSGGNECDLDFVLNAVPSVGTGTWTYTGPGTASFVPNANAAGATVTVSAYGTYTFTWTEVNGTCSSFASVGVNFYQQPTPAAAGPDQTLICGLVAILAGNNPAVGTGLWSVVTKPVGSTVTFLSASDYNATATVDMYGTYTYKWTITNGTCSSSDNVDITYYPKVTVSGKIYYNNSAGNIPMKNLIVTLTSGATVYSSPATGDNGEYTISSVCPGTYDVGITGWPTAGGINATDAGSLNGWYVAYTDFALKLKPPIEKVRFFAGDVADPMWRITPDDAGEILRYFVQSGLNGWADGRGPWTFWQPGMTNVNPTAGTLIPTITIAPGPTTQTQDWLALCTGDFNRSFDPYALKSGSNSLQLTTAQTRQAETGSEIELPVYTGSAMKVGAVSMILNFPSDKVEIMGVNLKNDPNTSLMYTVSGGELRIGWNSIDPLNLKAGEKLLTLKVRITGTLGKGEFIRFSLANDDLNELADGSYNVIDGAVLFVDQIDATTGINNVTASKLTLANYPNPFTEQTTFAYTLPQNGKVSLEIYNMLGSKVKVLLNEIQTAGDHTLTMDSRIIEPGVYTVILRLNAESKLFTGTIKIVRSE